MPTSDPVTTCRYVSDGRLARRITREGWARLRRPWVLVSFVAFGVALGVVGSLSTNAGSLPDHLGRVLLIGVIWGIGWLVVVAALAAVVVVPLVRWRERRIAAQYPTGSVTEIAVGVDGLVVVRPSGKTEIPYAAIRLVRTYGSLLAIRTRGRVWPELLPTAAMSEVALEYLTVRAQGAWPAGGIVTSGEGTRRFVVPRGWAGHIAAVYTMRSLRRSSFLLRFGLVALVLLVVSALVDPAWALVVPGLLIVLVVGVYVPTRRNAERALPEGSTATTEFREDGFVSRNVGGAREILYADIRSVMIHGDVLVMALRSGPNRLFPRALFSDEVLDHLAGETGRDHPRD